MTAKQLIWALHGVEDLELKDCGLTTEILEEFYAKEIVHAHWIYSYDESRDLFFKRQWECSACHRWQTYGVTPYCPYCGAKMDEQIDEG